MSEIVLTRPLAGIPLRITTLHEATRWICHKAACREPEAVDIHLANAYTIALAESDPEYRAVLLEADTILPDGRPMVWLTRFTRRQLHQVRGPRLFEEVISQGRTQDLRHFLLGATDCTLGLLQLNLERRYPGVRIVGRFSPPFRPMTCGELLSQDDLIRAANADIVWVGLGTPRQDFESQRLARTLGTVAIAIGAAFDFSAGTLPIAPRWMTWAGLEWLYRLACEPRRLWKRYLFGNATFLRSVLTRRESSHG